MIVVTAAAGQLGRLVIDALLARGVAPADLVATSRDASKLAHLATLGITTRQADYDDTGSMTTAFAGADVVYLVSGETDVEPRKRQHRNAIAAAQAAGVGRVVYTSFVDVDPASPFPFAAIHADTEAALRESGLAYTVLRHGLYLDVLSGPAQHAATHGVYASPVTQGTVSAISRVDLARAAAAVLTDPAHGNAVHLLVNEVAYTPGEIAATFAQVFGTPVVHQPMPLSAYEQMLLGFGLPPFAARAITGMQQAVDEGRISATSRTVRQLTGGTPETLEGWLRRTLAH